MKKILILLGAILFSSNILAEIKAEEVSANEGAEAEAEAEADEGSAAQEEEEPEATEEKNDDGYDINIAGWGRNDREILNDYGAVLNYVDGFLDEIMDNDQLSVFYTFDSSQFSDPKSM